MVFPVVIHRIGLGSYSYLDVFETVFFKKINVTHDSEFSLNFIRNVFKELL